MTKVFGAGSPEWVEGRNSQIAPSGTAARALAQTDFVGIAIHCAAGGGICNANAANARPDSLPDEAGGYTGFKGALRREVREPGDQPRRGVRQRHRRASRSRTRSASAASRASTGCSRKNTLGEVAQMQEAGVPVTFAYISDAHDFHGVSGNDPPRLRARRGRLRPAAQGLRHGVRRLLHRLKNDGITKDNTLFVVTVEEGDHFAGTQPDDARATA